ncbi:MAG: mechanosensitive ion channel [Rhodospirillaceae bacterium]|nr:mechanosensitive ion channel [Rhodospirillaceae bacterium]MBT6118502.1 mechanosensitive ion channel [Rhodospirillaceae bacterium]
MAVILQDASDLVVPYALDVLTAIAILVGGWILAGWLKRSTRRALARIPGLDDTLEPFIASIVRYLVLILVLIAVLAQFGVQTTSVIAILGAAGLAIGLALQGTLSNLASGLMILFLRPFKMGDFVDCGSVSGTIDEIGLFTTQMTTYDGIFLMVPNSQLWNSSVTNYSRHPTRMIDHTVGIAYSDDIDKAMAAIESVVEADKRCLDHPEPAYFVGNLGASSVDLTYRVWATVADFWPLKRALTKAVKEKLDAEGISIPFPQTDVHLYRADTAE